MKGCIKCFAPFWTASRERAGKSPFVHYHKQQFKRSIDFMKTIRKSFFTKCVANDLVSH